MHIVIEDVNKFTLYMSLSFKHKLHKVTLIIIQEFKHQYVYAFK